MTSKQAVIDIKVDQIRKLKRFLVKIAETDRVVVLSTERLLSKNIFFACLFIL